MITRTMGFSLIMLMLLLCLSCEKNKEIKDQIVGSWRIKRANIHSIYSFRANGSWVEQTRVEGNFSRIIENKKEIEGVWDVEAIDSDTINLIMTPNESSEDKWVKGETVVFEIASIDPVTFALKRSDGNVINWSRVRGTQEDGDDDVVGITTLSPGPVIVNLKQERSHEKFRFLCIDLEFSVLDIEENEYVAVDRDPEAGTVTCYLHPKIREVAIYYFSSLTYKDIKSLDKVKESVDTLTTILKPYFQGDLQKITVKKVVVTANKHSVEEFEKYYAALEEAPAEGAEIEE